MSVLPVMVAWTLMNAMTTTESSAPEVDLCMTPGMGMYCQCDEYGIDQATKVTCYVFSNLPPNSSSWSGFRLQRNIHTLSLTSHQGKPLTSVPTEVLKHLHSLNSFTVNDAMFGVLQSHTFYNLSEVGTLSLERNDIYDLERMSIASLPKLTKLELSDNQISRLRKDALHDLPRLSSLYLGRNNLTVVEDSAFSDLISLSELDLSDNRIHRLTDKTFRGLRNLRRLDLFRNQLTRLDQRAFAGAPNLHELVLKNNLITKLSADAFEGLEHLMTLELNHNGLRALPPNIFRPTPNLRLLELSVNRFHAIDRTVVESLSHSRSDRFVMYFKDNPLHCVCRLLWVSEYELLSKSTLFLRELRHASCQLQPPEGSNDRKSVKIRIHHLSPDDLNCTEINTTTTTSTIWRPTTDPSSTQVDTSEVIAPRMVSQPAIESSLEMSHQQENGGNLPPEDIREPTQSDTQKEPSGAARWRAANVAILCTLASALQRTATKL